MNKKFKFKLLFFAVLLSIPLVLGAISDGYAGAPEPPGAGKIVGKGIDGVLVAQLDDEGDSFTAIIVGRCNKTPVVIGPNIIDTTPAAFAAATADDIENWCLYESAPYECFDELVTDVVITRAKNVNNTGTVIGADVTVQPLTY